MRADPSPIADAAAPKLQAGQWAHVAKPTVLLAGGAFASDALPPFDAEAKFYLAPSPFAACGGLLAVLDADSAPDGLSELARLWLIPGQYGTGTILLRSGERIEVPWRASTLIFSLTAAQGPALRSLPQCRVDASSLDETHLRGFLTDALAGIQRASAELVETLAALLTSLDLATREVASRMAGYLAACSAYEGADFDPGAATLQRAIEFARQGADQAPHRAQRAA